jgi:hypothetical protein
MAKRPNILVSAIRNHPTLGRGSSSLWENHYDDNALLKELKQHGIDSCSGAIDYCMQVQGLLDDIMQSKL